MFCSGGNLTREHVFPQWITKARTGAAPTGAVVDEGFAAPFRSLGGDPDSEDGFALRGHYRNRPAIFPWHMTVKSVCGPCNNGWMSALEVATQPLIERLWSERKVQLTRGELATLVHWCQKMLVMLDCWQPQQKVVTAEVLEAIPAGGDLPGRWDVRIARALPELEFAWHHTPLMGPGVTDGEVPGPVVVGAQSLFVIGDVLFMVRYSPHADFRAGTALDADYYQVSRGPAVLLGRGARRIIKPGGLPVYTGNDLNGWALWSVSEAPERIMPAVKTESDGTTWVGDVREVFETDDIELRYRPLDASNVLAQAPIWED